MAEQKIYVYTTSGEPVGYFLDPRTENLSDKQLRIFGNFYEAGGQLAKKIEFNPQILPYNADTSSICAGKKLSQVYVQHAHQPVEMTGCLE